MTSATHKRSINADWHRAHPMPKNPTERQRAEWHRAHAQACRCRAVTASIAALIATLDDAPKCAPEAPKRTPTARRPPRRATVPERLRTIVLLHTSTAIARLPGFHRSDKAR